MVGKIYTRQVKKKTAMIFCICMVTMLFLSSLFIVSHAKHHCQGDACSVCAQIQVSEQVLKLLGSTLVTLFAAVIGLQGFIRFSKRCYICKRKMRSLVDEGIRMDN